MRIRDINNGARITFSSIKILNPETKQDETKGGFEATATDQVMKFPDGKYRRLFVDIDPNLTGGHDRLWVEVEDDLAEDLFGAVADNVDRKDSLIVIDGGYWVYWPGYNLAASGEYARVLQWFAKRYPDKPFSGEVIANWTIEKGNRSVEVSLICNNRIIDRGDSVFFFMSIWRGHNIIAFPLGRSEEPWLESVIDWRKGVGHIPVVVIDRLMEAIATDDGWTMIYKEE